MTLNPSRLLMTVAASALALAGLLCATTSRAQAGNDQAVDDVVAVIDNNVITRNELKDRTAQIAQQFKAAGRPLPASGAELERQVLEKLIVEQLQLRQATETGIVVTDAELDAAIQQIAGRNGLTVRQWLDKMRGESVSVERLRRELREEILIARLRDREVDSKVQVFEPEIEALLAEQGGTGTAASAELRIAQILVRVPEGASIEQAGQLLVKAEALLAQVRTAPDFIKFGEAQRDAAGTVSVADLGLRPSDRLPKMFVDAVGRLQEGEIAPWLVQSPNGFHILKLVERRAAGSDGKSTATQVHARHLLIRVSDNVNDQQAYRRIVALKAGIAPRTDFAQLARANSQDPSAAQGGDLGWLTVGEIPPEFREAIATLQPGQISDPIRSAVGYHLVQVVERREVNVSNEQRREAARNAIREHKIERAYDDWINQLRRSAYVEYRIDR